MDENSIVSVADLTKAIMNSPDNMGISEMDAGHIATHVLNFFGYLDRIIDNVLEPEDRDMFYMLEDATILTTEREETTLYDGREWRINYWLFRKDKIIQLMNGGSGDGAVEAEDRIYSNSPLNAWDRE